MTIGFQIDLVAAIAAAIGGAAAILAYIVATSRRAAHKEAVMDARLVIVEGKTTAGIEIIKERIASLEEQLRMHRADHDSVKNDFFRLVSSQEVISNSRYTDLNERIKQIFEMLKDVSRRVNHSSSSE